MSRSLKVAPSFISVVKSALRLKGFESQRALADKVQCGRDTIRKFLRGDRIDYYFFERICQELGLNWQEIVKNRFIPHNLPKPSYTAFIGRDAEKKRLLELLSPDHGANIITVDGIGGAGKTALVIAAAYECLIASQENLLDAPIFDAIIFTSAKQQYLTSSGLLPKPQAQRNLRDIFREIGRTIKDETITEASPEEQFNCVNQSLAKQQTLLIVDNLETVEDKANILGFLFDLPRTVKSVVTTREQNVIHVPIRLASLPETDSLKLIQQQAQEKRTQDKQILLTEAEQRCLYEATSGIPVVIVYAIGRLANSSSLQTVINDIVSVKEDVAHFLFTQSASELRGQPAHKLLMALAIFQDAPVRDALAKVAGLQTDLISTVDKALERLQQLSLVSQRDNRYSMLSLTREYTLAQLATCQDFEKEARESWVRWYLDFAAENGGVDWGPTNFGYSQLQQEWGNLITVIEWCAAKNRYNDVKNFWQHLNDLAYGYGYWQERSSWLEWLIQESQLRSDWATFVDIASSASWLFMRWYSPKNWEKANNLLTRAWEFRNYVDLSIQDFTAHNIAELHILLKEYNEARIWLDRQEELINGADIESRYRIRRLLTVLYSRAEILYLEGNYDNARILFQQVTRQAEEIQWQRYSNYAQNWLADISIIKGELEHAEILLKTGLAVAEQNNLKRRIYCYKTSYAQLEKARGNLEEARDWAGLALDGFNQLGMMKEAEEVRFLLNSLE